MPAPESLAISGQALSLALYQAAMSVPRSIAQVECLHTSRYVQKKFLPFLFPSHVLDFELSSGLCLHKTKSYKEIYAWRAELSKNRKYWTYSKISLPTNGKKWSTLPDI